MVWCRRLCVKYTYQIYSVYHNQKLAKKRNQLYRNALHANPLPTRTRVLTVRTTRLFHHHHHHRNNDHLRCTTLIVTTKTIEVRYNNPRSSSKSSKSNNDSSEQYERLSHLLILRLTNITVIAMYRSKSMLVITKTMADCPGRRHRMKVVTIMTRTIRNSSITRMTDKTLRRFTTQTVTLIARHLTIANRLMTIMTVMSTATNRCLMTKTTYTTIQRSVKVLRGDQLQRRTNKHLHRLLLLQLIQILQSVTMVMYKKPHCSRYGKHRGNGDRSKIVRTNKDDRMSQRDMTVLAMQTACKMSPYEHVKVAKMSFYVFVI
uniref:Uncharacterized protein n=1 Tax=Lygus hesperus TaxID=30085 RepID=A0A0A9WMP3_LYGHE